jgi:NADH-quinone oxidoreductase subunit J
LRENFVEIAIFVFLACGCALTGMLTVTCRKPIHSSLYLAATSLCVGLLCILLSAPFLGLAQILVCAAGIALLGAFVSAVLNLGKEQEKGMSRILLGGATGGIVLGVLGYFFWHWWGMTGEPVADEGTPFSELVFGEFLLPVELVAFLLLVALLGSVLLTRRERAANAGRSRL